MSRKTLTFLLTATLLLTLTIPARASDPITDSLAWLKTQQQPNGGFTNGFSEGSDLGTTCDIIIAITTSDQDASVWTSDDGNSPLDYLHAQVAGGAVDTLGLAAKVVLALVTTGQSPASFAGSDLIAELNGAYNEDTNSYGDTVFDHALVMLALSNAGQPVPDGAIQYLLDNQGSDGEWALFGGADGVGDTNTTALAVQALLATGHREGLDAALSYFHGVQNEDGGFPYQVPSDYGTDTDTNSTAVVLQALLAAGESLSDWTTGGVNPLDALTALHDSESGAFFWQAALPSPNVLATAQAIPALANYTFVNLPRVAATNPPGSPSAVSDATILPESGGIALLPAGLVALGLAALGTGIIQRRR